MAALIWLHEEALSLTHPVFDSAPPDTQAVFIWDEAYFREQAYSLKRLVFLYECVADLGIMRVNATSAAWLLDSPHDKIYVPASPNPWIRGVIQAVAEQKEVCVIAAPPAFCVPAAAEYRRFFPFWRDVENSLDV